MNYLRRKFGINKKTSIQEEGINFNENWRFAGEKSRGAGKSASLLRNIVL